MGCSNCSSGSCSCSSSSSSCGCGGDCGQPTKIITKQGLTGPQGPAGADGADGANGSNYYFQINQTIDFLDTFTMLPNGGNTTKSIGSVGLLPSAAGENRPWQIGTPIKLYPTSEIGNPDNVLNPVPKIEGIVSGYNPVDGSMGIHVYGIQGTGTYSDWVVDISHPFPTTNYLNGITLPPSAAGSTHGLIVIPGNTIFKPHQIIETKINGIIGGPSANDMIVRYDGNIIFQKTLTVADTFDMNILINVADHVSIITKMTTGTGTDDHEQRFGGAENPANATYELGVYANNFKTQKEITFDNYGPSNPYSIYSGTAYRL